MSASRVGKYRFFRCEFATPRAGARSDADGHRAVEESPAHGRLKYVLRRTTEQDSAMVRKKKLSPSGAKDEDGEYHNVHINLHEDELAVAGMDIGDEVFVRVRDNKIIIQQANPDDVEHEF